ncbi:MAG: acyl-CoA dehydrogenase family protein [bacterium]
MITFDLTKEQELILKTAREFAGGELKDIARDCDEEASVPKKLLDKAWEMGLANAAVPEAYDGIGMERSAVTSALVYEELGYGCASLTSAIMAPTAFIQPLIDFGTEAQKKKYLPLYGGEKFEPAGLALHEPHFTFDPTDMKTVATKKGDGWVINGLKRLVPFGSTAHYFLVLANNGSGPGLSNIEAFIVPSDRDGLTVSAENEQTMGLRALPMSQLKLENVQVSADERLGGENGISGQRLINSIRIANSAICVGLSRAVMDMSIPYAKDRIAFGQPIAKKQAIAFMLADMRTEVESMRWLVWKAASQMDQGTNACKATILAQNYVRKQTLKIADNGVQVFGGHGYIRDFPLEMWLRHAASLTLMEGVVSA